MPASVADAIAEELFRAGVTRVFGLPGGEVLLVIDALRRRGIAYTLCHHESAAGVAAAVHGKALGSAGVALTTLGPGAANLLLALAGSLLEREPLLAVTADLPASAPPTHTHQRVPLLDVFGPVTKVAEAVRPDGCRRAVRRALAAVLSEPQGPAVLTLSAEDARAEAGEAGEAAEEAEVTIGPTVAPASGGPPAAAAARLRERLASARRPLVLVGIGARWEDAPAVRAWLDAWRLPFGVTPKAKGMVLESHPGFVGVFGGMSLDGLMVEALEASDLVVGFGLDPVEIDKTWHAELNVEWVLASPPAAGRLPAGTLCCSHAALLELLGAEAPPRRWEDVFGDVRRRRLAALDQHGDALTPASILHAAAAAAPPGTVVTTDVGSHKYLFGQFWPSSEPGAFWMSNGLSGMGYGLPAALGLGLAWPERPVLAVLGDGGFAMTAAELETARREGAGLTVLVLADASLSLIRAGQRSRGLPRFGVDFGPVNTVAVAEGYGARAVRVSSAGELEDALARSLESRELTVVEAPLDPDLYEALV
jgi:acetolactate synthase I/II/III large subunit